MTDDDYEVEIGPGVVDIDANELAVRIFRVLTGQPLPENPKLIAMAMRQMSPENAALVAKLANTCVDYFAECVKGYARRA